jgi:hypothetical protein
MRGEEEDHTAWTGLFAGRVYDAKELALHKDAYVPREGEGVDPSEVGFSRDARTTRRLVRGGWVDDENGAKVVEEMVRVLSSSPSERNRIAAARTLAALASVDVRRESNHTRERGQDSTAATAALRAFLSTPQGAELLSTLSPALLASPEPTVQESTPLPPAS